MNIIKTKSSKGRLLFYTIAGFISGVLLPILVTISRILRAGMPLSVDSFIEIQVNTPVIWIIDFIPIVTAYLSFAIGKRQKQLRNLADQFEANTIELIGFDFDNPVPKPGKDQNTKKQKLKWARKIINSLDRNIL